MTLERDAVLKAIEKLRQPQLNWMSTDQWNQISRENAQLDKAIEAIRALPELSPWRPMSDAPVSEMNAKRPVADVIARLRLVTTRDDGRPEAADLLADCLEFLKDDETPAECIARHRKDIDALMTLLARARTEREG